MNRWVTVKVGAFAAKTLTGEDKDEARTVPSGDRGVEVGVSRAIRFYLNDRDSDGPGWAYPEFLRGHQPGEEFELRLQIDKSLWRAFTIEARRQGVTVPQLLEHATMYYAAELDAGRVTERMLGDLRVE